MLKRSWDQINLFLMEKPSITNSRCFQPFCLSGVYSPNCQLQKVPRLPDLSYFADHQPRTVEKLTIIKWKYLKMNHFRQVPSEIFKEYFTSLSISFNRKCGLTSKECGTVPSLEHPPSYTQYPITFRYIHIITDCLIKEKQIKQGKPRE